MKEIYDMRLLLSVRHGQLYLHGYLPNQIVTVLFLGKKCYSLKIEFMEKAKGRYLDHLLPLIKSLLNEYGFQRVD